MITHSDDGPDFDPDDPLAVILRPPSEHLVAPVGRYEAVRRAAARRRMLRAAAGVGASCAVAAVLALPLLRTGHQPPASPVGPLAPPAATSRPAVPPPSPSASPGGARGTAPSTRPTPRPSNESPTDGRTTGGRGTREQAPTAAPGGSAPRSPDTPAAEVTARPGWTARTGS
ncbi:hypothetical protein ABZX30_04830 [Streptomyces sp. NPDC004542]|uniref:hypothetical protein n=1 Tax=Streptomyces sp. NPDC004542 TaxID=3154281 RepID=UPI0033A87A0A